MKTLPGNVRQRLKRAIDTLAEDPRPSKSKALKTFDETKGDYALWRLRLENWRVVYVISEREKTVDVLAVRKRPPYNYEDLVKLLEEFSLTEDEKRSD